MALRTSAKTSTYIPGLDGIRALAFLTVFFAHALPGISYYIPATLGVTTFFFLSGYLITTLLRRELAATGTLSLRNFYIRRTLRIFAPLYVTYAIVWALSRFVFHVYPGNALGHASVLLYFYNYGIALNWKTWLPPGMTVVWSLAVEEHFYLLFPLAYLTLARRRLAPATQTGLLAGFCLLELLWRTVLWTVLHKHNGWTYVATDARLDSILWGSILALRNNPILASDPPLLPRRYALPAAVVALAVLVGSMVPRNLLYRDTLRFTLQALALYVLFGYIIPHIRRPWVAWLEWQPLRYLGWLSYVLYLCHDFILHLIPDTLPLAEKAPLGFALSVAFAVLLRYTLELPLQHLRARFRQVPEADPAAPGGHGLIS